MKQNRECPTITKVRSFKQRDNRAHKTANCREVHSHVINLKQSGHERCKPLGYNAQARRKRNLKVFYDFNVNGNYINFEAGITAVNKQDYQQQWQHLP